eukprot:5500364-Amphidinium_carterae.1
MVGKHIMRGGRRGYIDHCHHHLPCNIVGAATGGLCGTRKLGGPAPNGMNGGGTIYEARGCPGGATKDGLGNGDIVGACGNGSPGIGDRIA